jgi:hypothetical protein
MIQEREKKDQREERIDAASKVVEAIETGLTAAVPVVITAHIQEGAEKGEEADFSLLVQKETTGTNGDSLGNIVLGGLILVSTGVVCLHFYYFSPELKNLHSRIDVLLSQKALLENVMIITKADVSFMTETLHSLMSHLNAMTSITRASLWKFLLGFPKIR